MKQRSITLLLAQALLASGCAGLPAAPTSTDDAPAKTRVAQSGPGGGSGSGGGGGSGNTPNPPANAILGQPYKPLVAYEDLQPANPAVYEFQMNVAEQDVQILNGAPTRMMTFNGQYPGPVIRSRAGEQVIAHVKNTTSSPITVHFHGMVIEPEHDGGPWNVISPGQDHTYKWIAKKEYPMSGWYHAHPHGLTHVQVPRGMVGTLEVLDPNDPIPAEYGDDWLVFSDQKYNSSNQIPADTEFDRFNGREGDHVFVNGREQPVFKMKPNEIHRFRVLDGGPARFYRLAAPGMEMWQIGTDGGLIEHPVRQTEIIMGVAERVEVLLKAPMTPGIYKVKSLRYDRGLGLRERFDRDLMTIEVTNDLPAVQPAMPQNLRTIEPLDLTGARQRLFELDTESVGQGMQHFVINEKSFDPLRIDNVAKLGDTEIWTIDNKKGNWDHPMHLHSVQFQELDVDGRPPAFRAWKDVMVAPRSTRIRFAVRYARDEFPGIFMFHCHILQHEDDGMMTHIMVNPAEPRQ